MYVHGDGAKCVGKPIKYDTDNACAGCHESASPDLQLHDMMSAGRKEFFFCTTCSYEKRADILTDVQEYMEKKRIDRKKDGTPRKTKKRQRTDGL